MEFDLAAERAAIEAYNKAITLAGELEDHATRDILIQILNDEDRHLDEIEELKDQIEHMSFQFSLPPKLVK